MSAEAADTIKNRFNDLSNEFSTTRFEFFKYEADIQAGCGEFEPSVADGADTFSLSWRETFDVCREAAALIAGNTNSFKVDLDALDQDYGHTPTL